MLNNISYIDILLRYQQDIDSIFLEAGAITPSLENFYSSSSWKKCQAINKKDKHKIGYLCQFFDNHHCPYVKIVVNNFRLGSAVFDSRKKSNNHKDTLSSFKAKRPSLSLEQKIKEDEEEKKRKEKDYAEKLQQWQQGQTNVKYHPYAIKKKLHDVPLLRKHQNLLMYPLTSIETGKICAIQTINAYGNKIIYGKSDKAYFPIGSIENAATLYLCEGLATANAVHHLAKKQESFAVINALNAGNLVKIALAVRQQFPHKKIIIAADNDEKTAEKGDGNAGLWHGSLAAIKTHAKLVYPKNNTIQNSDWFDAWNENFEEAQKQFNQPKTSNKQSLVLERFQFARDKISRSALYSAIRLALKFLATDFPFKKEEHTIIAALLEPLARFNVTEKTIKTLWFQVKKQCFAKALRAKSFSTQGELPYHVHTFNTMKELIQFVNEKKSHHQKAIFVTNAPMGTGKTNLFMKPHFMEDKARHQYPLIITPTRSLTHHVANKFEAKHYRDDAISDETDSLAITINSIIKPSFEDFLSKSNTLFMDEYTQILRAITTGTVKPEHRQQTLNTLSTLIQKSHYTYIADADLNQIALDDVLNQISDSHTIFVLTLKKQASATPYQLYDYPDSRRQTKGFHHLDDALQQKENAYIVCDSRKKIHLIEAYLHSKKITPLVITADTLKTASVRAFLQHPTDYLNDAKPSFVIASPSVQSGLSIESTYFHRVIGFYTGHVTPTVFLQMLHRVRPPIPRDIIFANRAFQRETIEQADTLLTIAYQHYIQQWGETKATYNAALGVTQIGRLSIKHTAEGLLIQGDEAFERLERLTAQIKTLDNQQKNNAFAFLLLQLQQLSNKTTLYRESLSCEEKALLKAQENNTLDAVKLNRQKKLCGKNKLTKSEYDQLNQKEENTKEDVYLMQRYQIATQLNIEAVEERDLDFIDNNGLEALKNLSELNDGMTIAAIKDEVEKRQAISKQDASWHQEKITLLNLLFETLGIHKRTGQGVYHKEKAALCRRRIQQSTPLAHYVLSKLNLNLYGQLSDVAWCNKILHKLLGLKAERVMVREGQGRSWYYSIQKSLTNLYSYADQKEDLSPETTIYNI